MQDHTVDLSSSLVRLGHEVDVITGSRPDGLRLEERDGVRWHFLDVVPKLRPSRVRNPRWFGISARAFQRLHAEDPYDVVHSESTSALGLVRRHVHEDVPIVAKFHGNYLGLARAAVQRARRERTVRSGLREAKVLGLLTLRYVTPPSNVYGFRDCEAIVPSQQQVRDTVSSHFLRPSRVHVVPNGIDVTVFHPRDKQAARQELGIGEGPLLVAVGRLSREKGLNVALSSLSRFQNGTAPHLVVVGDGDQRAGLERLASELGLGRQVTFAGRQEHSRVAEYLAAADAALIPTLREEAAPLVVPQAMAVGVPVIASAIGGVTEVIDRPGENGVLVPPGDVEALTEATARVLAHPEEAQRIGRAGRDRVLGEYTVEAMARRTLAVYETAVERLRSGKR